MSDVKNDTALRIISTRMVCAAAALVCLAMGAQSSYAQAPSPQPAAAARPVSSIQPRVKFANGVTGLMDVTYAAPMGFRPLKLDLYYQASNKTPRPAIVWLFGGGWITGTPRAGIATFGLAEKAFPMIAARGYIVAGVGYRLSGEAKFPAAIQDVKTAIRWLRANAAKYNIDPQRIAVWGESAGGHLAALAGTSCQAKALEGQDGNAEQSSCVQAAIDWFGPTDFSVMDRQAPPNARMQHDAANSPESGFLGCELPKCPATLVAAANPLTYITKDAPPFLIMHGDVDDSVPPQQSQILYDALKANGVNAKLEYIPGVGHGFSGATAAQEKHISETVLGFLDVVFAVKSGR